MHIQNEYNIGFYQPKDKCVICHIKDQDTNITESQGMGRIPRRKKGYQKLTSCNDSRKLMHKLLPVSPKKKLWAWPPKGAQHPQLRFDANRVLQEICLLQLYRCTKVGVAAPFVTYGEREKQNVGPMKYVPALHNTLMSKIGSEMWS